MSNSSDEPRETGSLSARASFPGTELQLLDDDRKLVDRGIDRLEMSSVPAGIYTVRAVLGSNHRDQFAVVRPGAPTHVDIEAPAMGSAMPIERTAKTHEYHQEAAEKLSRTDKLTLGAIESTRKSELFVMVREWNRDASKRRGQRPERVGGNLTLCDLAGATLFAYKDVEADPWGEGDDMCAAKTVVLPAGCVRLCAMNEKLAYDLPVYTAPGWQTQVYILASGAGGGVVAGDLAHASMTMRPIDRGFSRSDPDGQAIEGVRSALESSSGGVPDAILEGFLWEKFENPLLGLLAAHAMQQRGTLKHELLSTVASNLAGLLGSIPDVIALLLDANPTADVPPVLAPPMLRASWRILLDHSVARRELIPRHSLAARIATNVVGAGAWMVWQRVPDQGNEYLEVLQKSAGAPEVLVARGVRPVKSPKQMEFEVRWLGLPASMLDSD